MNMSRKERWRVAGVLATAMAADMQQRMVAWCERKLSAAHESRHVRKQFLIVYTDASDRAKVRACGDVALITEEVPRRAPRCARRTRLSVAGAMDTGRCNRETFPNQCQISRIFPDQNGPVRVIIARPVGECLARARRRAVVLMD